MKVLLINPPHTGYLCSEPTGLLILAAVLEENRHEVHVYDCVVEYEGLSALEQKAAEWSPSFIGISCVTWTANAAYEIGRKLRAICPSAFIVFGGVHPTFFPEEALQVGAADAVICGEAEEALVALVDDQSCDHPQVVTADNLACRMMSSAPPSPIDLDTIPLPAYHLVPFNRYNSSIHVAPFHAHQAAHIMATRGCLMNCDFCCSPALYGRSIRRRPNNSVAKEVQLLHENYGISYFHFVDDDLLFDPEYTLDIAQAISKAVPGITWVIQARCDSVLKAQSYLSRLRGHGCIGIEIGVEAAQKTALQGMNKSLHSGAAADAVKALKSSGIERLYLSLGYSPGETTDGPHSFLDMISRIELGVPWDYKETLRLMKDVVIFGHLMTPLPGSAFWSKKEQLGVLLMQGYEDLYTEKINFVPHSWMNDRPVRKIEKLPIDLPFDVIHFMRENNIYLEETCSDNYFSCEALWKYSKKIFSFCDGERTVRNIFEIMKEEEGAVELKNVASAISVLSVIGVITSNN